MIAIATFQPPKNNFIPIDKEQETIAYQCHNESWLRPEKFMIYYGLFRQIDSYPSPELVAKWKIKLK